MKKRTITAAAVFAAALLLYLTWPAPQPSPTPARTIPAVPGGSGFNQDKASDCWAHPDRLGRRHCSTRQP